MSMMDKLKRMLAGHPERTGDSGRTAAENTQDRPAGQVDKGPDALRQQMGSPQDRDNPPQP
ncbi:antitoxin [Streptomyces sp. NPDC003631]|jgi:hypothetical protein|uniref:Antitoxin n=1 Tax=Streptomyces lannensis TaxID=766498 RepID=A0ABP7KFA9_9ACTN|nr:MULTISPECIES: antitoxin [unclassified Streptomyces]MEE1670633.1 antitoxin [Streptomyces sp. WAC07094]TFV34226.1 antitoxin [Streptomyces sp. T1317-0309]KUJ37806.1 hypothetical protein ADL25_27420 [Streptomyces sp. NRRL F-5122]MDX3265200.1 antitoxin [Streptomyces sp. MI02-2A]REE58644.1 hypothetical protein BX257_1072 [Streptomyces sp. 3212.3]